MSARVFALCRDVLETHDFSKVQGNKISPHCTVHKIMKITEIVQKGGFYFKNVFSIHRIIFELIIQFKIGIFKDILEPHDFPKFRETRFPKLTEIFQKIGF